MLVKRVAIDREPRWFASIAKRLAGRFVFVSQDCERTPGDPATGSTDDGNIRAAR